MNAKENNFCSSITEPEWNSNANVIVVRKAYKALGISRHVVLSGLNMTVPEGKIYALLGPSGCGKTTLLNCIIGRMRLDAGFVFVKSDSIKKIGFMPQELGLFINNTIYEILYYYGIIYGFNKNQINTRLQELTNLLSLPPSHRRIDSLSGGQQRRVSLSVALLHNPDIYILDEPTVGLDPVLNESIWKQLLYLSQVKKKTIILTTHYIEEARQADTVALMRFGVLLDEANPYVLMEKYMKNTLEKVFLQLSELQSSKLLDNSDKIVDDNLSFIKSPEKPPLPFDHNKIFHWNHIKGLLLQSTIWLKNNLPIVGFLLLLPVCLALLVGYTIGPDPHGLRMGIVNPEVNYDISFCDAINLNKTACSEKWLSCYYLQKLRERYMILVNFDNEDLAFKKVLKNDVWGMIKFHRNYSENLLARYHYGFSSEDDLLDASNIEISMDMSNQYISNLLRRDILFGFLDFEKQLFLDCNWSIGAAGTPINFEEAVYGTNSPSFTHFAIPAIIQIMEFFLPVIYIGGALLIDRKEGHLNRSAIVGVTFPEIILNHMIINIFLSILQIFLSLFVFFVIFHIPFKGSFLLCIFLIAVIRLSGSAFGMLIGCTFDKEITALNVALGAFFALTFIGGMLWPFEAMHPILKSIGVILPLTITTNSLRSILIRGWDITHPAIYWGFISVSAWTMIFTVGAYIATTIKKKFGLS